MKKLILDAKGIERVLNRLAHQIIEMNEGGENLALVGIQTRGVPLSKRLAAKIETNEGFEIPVGTLDINLYRDDLSLVGVSPILRDTNIPFSVDGKNIILVDDVLFTGRTIRAALDALMDVGRPLKVQLAVLVDRNHRELPIEANFVGLKVETQRNDLIELNLTEIDGKDSLILIKRDMK